MRFRFRFTAGFLAVSVAIFALAAFLAIRAANSSEEAGVVGDISDQSEQSADLLAGVLGAYTAGGEGDQLLGAPPESATSLGFQNLVMSTLVQNSDIVRLSLLDSSGTILWASNTQRLDEIRPDTDTLATALSGEVATTLNRNVNFVTPSGEESTGDLTSTYIPIANGSSQVLEIARDVTASLDFRSENARNSMLRTLFSTLGAAFIVLFVGVVAADTVINRSRRKAAAQEVAIAESKVAAEKLELRNQQLQEINREHDRFLSMISHELRTPLTSMLAFTEVLKRRQDGENRDSNLSHLDLMRRNGDHLNSLIEELLEVTNMHSEEFAIEKADLSLLDLLEDVRGAAESTLAAKGQRLRISAPDEDMRIHADRRRMTQMLMNLISNSSAYSEDNTTITVEAEHSPEFVKLTVTDQGEGISEQDQTRLFEQFYRGNSAMSVSTSGLGLGLPIVKAIVDAHHGKISVKSQPGAGTEITVLLPVNAAVEAVAQG